MDFGPVILEAKNDKGRVSLYRPRPDVVVAISEGFITRELWDPQAPVYDAILKEVPKLSIYRDAWNVRSIESEYRDRSQSYVKAHREQFHEIVFLQRSALISLAVNAAALFSRAPIVAVGKETWEGKLLAALGKKAA